LALDHGNDMVRLPGDWHERRIGRRRSGRGDEDRWRKKDRPQGKLPQAVDSTRKNGMNLYRNPGAS